MNSLRGKNTHIPKISEPSPAIDQTEKIPRANSVFLSKRLFYACTDCEGPLVPISCCTFCKKTSIRKCTKCNQTWNIKNHESCKSLLSFARIIFQNIPKEVNL